MKVYVGISLVLLAGMLISVGGQSDIQTFCGDQPDGTRTLKQVLQQSLINAMTRYFADQVVGDDGFRPIDVTLSYELFELFTIRYNGPASTASVLNSFLDGFYSPLIGADTGDIAKVIGLIRVGEYDGARAEMFYLILHTINTTPDIGSTINFEAITNEQSAIIEPRIAQLYETISAAVSQSEYELFLSVRVGTTLSFAIDTTGSMAGEINDAKFRTIAIIKATTGTLNQPLRYVLSPFNDPGFGPITVTSDPAVITEALNNLAAEGGVDLPELSMKWIEQAILKSSKRSIVFMITDAEAQDEELESRVTALAIIKKVRVLSLLTNRLPNPNGFPLYDRIAKASCGLVTVTSKSDFNTVTQLFNALTAQGRVILLNAVDRNESTITFAVDSTLDYVTILLSGLSGSFVYDRIENEAGNEVTNVTDLANATGLRLLRVPVGNHTAFTVYLSTAILYNVEVLALSIFGAIPTMFEEVDEVLVHRAQPRAGTTAHVFGHLFGDVRGAELTKISLVTLNGTEILSRNIDRCGSSNEEFRTNTSFKIPEQRFFIDIQTFCGDQPDGTRTLKQVLQQSLINAMTRYFADQVVGDDGFRPIDVTLSYELFELFTIRYNGPASTASVLNSFLDGFYSPLIGADTGDTAKVIGLIQVGEYDVARAEMFYLILHTINTTPGIGSTINFEAITNEQSAIIEPRIAQLYETISAAVSQSEYEVYLSVRVGTTLSFAIDTTGSMGGEINDAKLRTIAIIKATTGTLNQPLRYVLSPFNDPGYGPITVTSDPAVITQALNNLAASGGDDFPELSMKGIEQAILKSSKRSIVFMITDAEAQDEELESRVTALAIIKKVRVLSLLTNRLPNPNGFPLYDRIAKASCGLVTVTSKSDFNTVTQLFNALTAQGRVILLNAVDRNESTITFAVDSTLDYVTILLSGLSGSFVYDRIENEAGNEVTNVTDLSNATGLRLLRVPVSNHTAFTVYLSTAILYNVEVSALSIFGAIPTMFEEVNGVLVHRAQPRAGTTAHVFGHLFGDVRGAELTKISLVTLSGNEILSRNIDRCGSSNEEFRTNTSFKIPEQRFFIRFQGTINGRAFTRMDPCAVSPLSANITLDPIADQLLDPGTTITVITYLHTDLEDSFTFDISDPRGYAFSIISSSVINGTTTRLNIKIIAPADALPGSLSPVLLTATPAASSEFVFQSFNVLIRDAAIKCPVELFSAGEGTRITCTDVNNDGSQCTVECGPDYVLDGTASSTCVNGTWTVDNLRCNFVERQTCSAVGASHYKTFDGKYYDFYGTCIYTLVETTFKTATGQLRPFSILVENQFLGGNTRVSWLKRASLNTGNHTIQFIAGNQIRVDGIDITPPYALISEGVTLVRTGRTYELTTTFGLTITYNGFYNFRVSLSGSYGNLVTGLCGNLNGNMSDDLVLPSNTSIILNAVEFGNSQKVGGNARCIDGVVTEGKDCLDEAAYEKACNVINKDCFRTCRERFPEPEVVRNCVFDGCVTEGDLRTIERAISDYADQCQKAGIEVCNWTNVTGLPTPPCPANSHYEHEGTACPNTCRRPTEAARCKKPQVSGCVCNDGYVLSGLKCVPLTDCGCSATGVYYESGHTFVRAGCTERCTCSRTVLTCTATSCGTGEVCQVSPTTRQLGCVDTDFGDCVAAGYPHYVSFDGCRFDFQGACRYLLFEGTNSNTGNHLSVVTQNEFRNGVTQGSSLKSVKVAFSYDGRDVTVMMNRDGSRVTATVWNLLVNVTFTTMDRTIGGVQIFTSGRSLVLEIENSRVKFNGNYLKLRVPGAVRRVRGLCGDFNGDPTDDFRNANGTVVTSVNDFGKSFQVGDCATPEPPPEFVCSDTDRALYAPTCNIFKATSEVFAACSSVVNFTALFNDCLYDVCATRGNITIVKDVLDRALEDCRAEDVPLCDAREQLNMTESECPSNSHYETCSTGCPNSCSDPSAEDRCALPTVDGCVCNFGYVWENGVCVRPDSCGCYPDDRVYVPQGFTETTSDCSHRCACNGPNKWECNDLSCSGEEECVAVGGDYRCLVSNAECLVWGNSFVSTFDGRQYNFHGSCQYIAMGVLGSEELGIPTFRVTVQRNHKLANGKRGLFVTLTTISEPRFEVLMHSQWNFVKVDDLDVLPGSNYRGVHFISRGSFMTVRFEFGITLRLSSMDGLVISVSGLLRDRTTGLCGTFDNNPHNDYIMDADGTLASGVAQFGNAWKWPNVPDNTCSDGRESLPCPNSRFLDYLQGPSSCGVLDSAIFDSCRSVVDKTAHQWARVNSLCNAGRCDEVDFLHAIETTLFGFITECVVRGGTFPTGVRPWIGFRATCLENSHYEEGASPCQPTCSDKDGSMCLGWRELVRAPVVEGCLCDEGYIFSAGECVPLNKCGCLSEGLFYKHGHCQADARCEQKCQCRNGDWDCERDTCLTDEICGLRDGEWGCHYTDLCKHDNGGCSQNCSTSNGTTICSCYPGYALGEDGKTCFRITFDCPSAIKESGDDFGSGFIYTRTFLAESFTPACTLTWTTWFDTDNPTGCGDDESWKRIRSHHPDTECDHPVAVDKKIIALRSPGTVFNVTLRYDSPEEGVMCDNTDQEDGNLCPDYKIRFLCVS